MTEIPLIDLTPARIGGEAGKRKVAEEINQACKEIGFFTVMGHGIDEQIIARAYQSLDAFFALPLEEKKRCVSTQSQCFHQHNGYSPMLAENAHAFMGRKNLPSDYVEKFSMGTWLLDDDRELTFPSAPSCRQLRANMKRYYQACLELTSMLTELFAIAVDLPRDFFIDKMDEAFDFLRFHNFPGMDEKLLNDQGIAEHNDHVLLTLLTGTSGGLEVKSRDGQWIEPQSKALGHFIVNIGDLMMRWSNDEWVSTPHRVTLSGEARQSIPFFKVINEDTLIETFPKFCENKPSRYPPISFADFTKEKTDPLYGKTDPAKQ